MPFAAWENFYVIAGTAAGALIGLQFIVIVLGAQAGVIAGDATRAFGSPNIVHFCSVLLVSALVCAPWQSVHAAAACLIAIGLAGIAYVAVVLGHARRQTHYVPEFEDWLWYFTLPFVAYAAMLGAAIALTRPSGAAMFVIGGATLLLLFTAIHNAWDSVTYIAAHRSRREEP